MQMCQSCQGEGMENIWPAVLWYVQLDVNEVLARNTDKNGHKVYCSKRGKKRSPKPNLGKRNPLNLVLP